MPQSRIHEIRGSDNDRSAAIGAARALEAASDRRDGRCAEHLLECVAAPRQRRRVTRCLTRHEDRHHRELLARHMAVLNLPLGDAVVATRDDGRCERAVCARCVGALQKLGCVERRDRIASNHRDCLASFRLDHAHCLEKPADWTGATSVNCAHAYAAVRQQSHTSCKHVGLHEVWMAQRWHGDEPINVAKPQSGRSERSFQSLLHERVGGATMLAKRRHAIPDDAGGVASQRHDESRDQNSSGDQGQISRGHEDRQRTTRSTCTMERASPGSPPAGRRLFPSNSS